MMRTDQIPKAPVYIVTHPTFEARYNYIRAHLAHRSSRELVIVGVNGRDIIAKEGDDSKHNPKMSPGQIGCALSHVAAYRHMVENHITKAIVVEDDAIVPADFDDLCDLILQELREGEWISLHSPARDRVEMSSFGAKTLHKSRLVTPMKAGPMRTNLCYAIDVEAARRVIALNDPVKFVADRFVDWYGLGAVNYLRLLSPSPIKTGDFRSSIGELADGYSQSTLSRILNSAPVISSIMRTRRRRLRAKNDGNHAFLNERSPLHDGNPRYDDWSHDAGLLANSEADSR